MRTDWQSLRIALLTFLLGWFILLFSFVPPASTVTATSDQSDWDKSSLYFDGKCDADCDKVEATVCNGKESQIMFGRSRFEVYFAATGNPKNGEVIASGVIDILSPGTCTELFSEVSQPGNYMFKAYQRAGHPGTGELWSEQCEVTCVSSPSPSPTHPPCPWDCSPSPTPSPDSSPSPTPSSTPSMSPTPSSTSTPSPSPTPSDVPSPSPSVLPSLTPLPTPSPTISPTPSVSPSPSPSPEVTPSPSPFPTPSDEDEGQGGPSDFDDDEGEDEGDDDDHKDSYDSDENNDLEQGVLGSMLSPSTSQDAKNPLLSGLQYGGGEILGVSTAWPSTGRENSSQNLPTNLESTDTWLSIPALGKNWLVHQGQRVGQDLIVGDQEVSVVPGTNDQILYAHNTDELFGSLVKLHSLDRLYLGTKGELVPYQLRTQRLIDTRKQPLIELSPDDNEVWLVTCRDADSSWRVVYSFDRV